MSFYRRQPLALGFAWIPAVVQVVGGALKSQPLEVPDIKDERTSPIVIVLASVVGLGVLGGLGYAIWRAA